MTTTIPPAALVPVGPVFSEPERLALAGFLASYTGPAKRTCWIYASSRLGVTGAASRCSPRGGPLALNGLRVSEAVGVDIENLAVQRGHRTLAITRKGGKKAVVPLALRTARAIDLATGDRCDGPIFLSPSGARLDRHGAGRIVRRVARRAGLAKTVGPHTLRHAFITAAVLMPAYPSATCRKPPRTPTRAPLSATTGREPPSTGTPLT